jgi:hypothetical protein
MNKIIIGSMAALLSFGAVACGSDKKTSSTSATTASAGTGDSTATSSGSAKPLGTKQAAVLAKTEAQLDAASLTYDKTCVSDLISQLTDADADLIMSAVPPETVTASPAGEAIGQQLLSCVTTPTTDVTATT